MDLKKINIVSYGYDLDKHCEACLWKNSEDKQEQRELSKLSLGYVESILCEKCLADIRELVENTIKK